jgi:Mg-chelatase subunit ChlI
MTAFDTVHDRLDAAVDALVSARVAYREHHKTQPIRRIHRMGDDPTGDAILTAEYSALLKVVAAFHYAEQVSASEYSGESTLAFEKRERQWAAGDEVITSNRDDAEGETRLEQLGRLYYNEQERCRNEYAESQAHKATGG